MKYDLRGRMRASLNSKCYFIYVSTVDILLPNLIALILIVPEISAFIQTEIVINTQLSALYCGSILIMWQDGIYSYILLKYTSLSTLV